MVSMQRKVNQIGPSTLMVSLPSKWTKKYNVKKGDVVNVNEEGNSLHINIENSTAAKKKATITLNQANTTLARYYLAAAYRAGIDEIEIEIPRSTIRDEKQNKEINVHEFLRTALDNFVGMSIVRNTPNLCVIKEIAAMKQEEFDTMHRRIFYSLLVTFDDLIANIQSGNSAALQHMYQHADAQVNKFVDYCLRILEKTKSMKPVLYNVLLHLEEIGDGLKYIAKQAALKKTDKSCLALVQEMKQLFMLVEKYYYTGKEEVLVEYESSKRAFRKNLSEAEKSNDAVILLKLNKMMSQTAGIIDAKLLMHFNE